MKQIIIVEFPSNLGLREIHSGHEPGVNKLPKHLFNYNFHKLINPKDIIRLDAPDYSPLKNEETGILNSDSLVNYAPKQAEIIRKIIDSSQIPLIIGGDCSILLGTAIALKQLGRYALIYLDGHTDFMGLHLSESGGIGGMAAAVVTGYGHDSLSNIGGLKPYIRTEDLWCVGNREYDEEYEDEIRNSTATYKTLNDLREDGIEHIINNFLKIIEAPDIDGFFVHLDVDILNDDLMPCVDSRTPDGLTYSELNQILHPIFRHNKFSGIEITILDPDLDIEGRYAKEFINNFTTTLIFAEETF